MLVDCPIDATTPSDVPLSPAVPERGAADDLESPTGYGQGTFIVLPEVAFASRRSCFLECDAPGVSPTSYQ